MKNKNEKIRKIFEKKKLQNHQKKTIEIKNTTEVEMIQSKQKVSKINHKRKTKKIKEINY